MNKVQFLPFEPDLLNPYRDFARKSWGEDAYQSKAAYLDWLYRENPAAAGRPTQGPLLAVDGEGKLVGAIHKMGFLWNLDGEIASVPAIHNLYVSEEYRTGTGLYLILAMLKTENDAFSPSQVPPLTNTYSKLKWQEASVLWYRRILAPASAAVRLARVKVFGLRPARMNTAPLSQGPTNLGDGVQVTARPDSCTIAHLSQRLARRLETFREKPHWTEEVARWRFFHPFGPQHILVHNHGDEFLILSLGQRHGLTTSRIMEASCSSPERLAVLVRKAERFLAANGVHVLLGFSGDDHINRALSAAGWRPETGHLRKTFFFHRDKTAPFTRYAFNASAGDFGFEAFH